MLNLGPIGDERVVEKDSQYEFYITFLEVGIPVFCDCQTLHIVRNGTKRVMYFDTPMHGKRVGIWVNRRRYLCRDCKRTEYEELPEMHPKHAMTNRLVDYIQKFGTERTFTAIANEVGIDVQTVRGIWRTHAEKELNRLQPVTPEWMGIDELFIMRGFRGIITNVKERTIVDILESRRKEDVVRYLAGLEDREKISIVAMDMWDPYREAVQMVLPKAEIVVDRFHVSRMATAGMETIRKNVRAKLPLKERLTLRGDRWMLLRNTEDLSALQNALLESVLAQHPLLNHAYQAKEAFRRIWKCNDAAEAKERYAAWLRELHPDVLPAFDPLKTAMENWRDEIFAYFRLRVTNAYTESFNAIARKMDRMGRGYSFKVLRAKLLLKHSCHKMAPPAPFVRNAEASPHSLGLDMSTLAAELEKLPETG